MISPFPNLRFLPIWALFETCAKYTLLDVVYSPPPLTTPLTTDTERPYVIGPLGRNTLGRSGDVYASRSHSLAARRGIIAACGERAPAGRVVGLAGYICGFRDGL